MFTFRYGCEGRFRFPVCVYSAFTDSNVSHSETRPGLRYTWTVSDRSCTIGNKFVVVELNTIRRLMFDPLPQCLEFFTFENDFAGSDCNPLVRVFNIELPCELSQDIFNAVLLL